MNEELDKILLISKQFLKNKKLTGKEKTLLLQCIIWELHRPCLDEYPSIKQWIEAERQWLAKYPVIKGNMYFLFNRQRILIRLQLDIAKRKCGSLNEIRKSASLMIREIANEYYLRVKVPTVYLSEVLT